MSDETVQQPIQAADPDAPVKKTRKPRKPKDPNAPPKPPKVKKVKPARDLRSVFRQKLSEVTEDSIKKPWMAEKSFRLVDNAQELEAWVDGILADTSRHYQWAGKPCPVIAVDTETTSLDTRILFDLQLQEDGTWKFVYKVHTELAGVCLSADGIEGLYVPVNHEKGDNVSRVDCARILQKLFDQSHLVFYNAKFDREVLRISLGLNLRGYPHFEDVQVLKYINDPKADLGDKGAYSGDAKGLKGLSKTVLGIEQIELEELAKVRAYKWNAETQKNTLKDQHVPFTWIPTRLALWYAAGDAICTWLLWDRMKDLARSRKLVHRIDHELVETLTFVERQRFRIDVNRQRRTARWHSKKTEGLSKKLREMALAAGWQEKDGEEFNPGSTKQLGELLFKKMGFKPYRTTDSGNVSTDKETLTELAKDFPDNEFLQTLKKFRDYAALHPENLKFDPRDNSARMYLKQNVVGGGRLSGAGGEFERDGGFELNPQGVKKLEPDQQWRVYGNVLDPDEIPADQVDMHEESDLHPSCFKTEEKETIVGYQAAEEASSSHRVIYTDSVAGLNRPQDANAIYDWYKIGNQSEDQFCESIAPLIGIQSIINPAKTTDPTALDLVVNGAVAELKTQNTPYFLASRDYGVSPQFAFSFNRGDYRSYKNKVAQLGDFDIYLWVNWNSLEGYGVSIEPMSGVWKAKFSQIAEVIESGKAKVHEYPPRGGHNETHSYGLDLRWFEQVAEFRHGAPEPKLVPIKEKHRVQKKAPSIVNNHIGMYQGYAICLVPSCTTCAEKFSILIPNTSMDANETVNLRCLFVAQEEGWTFFSIDYSNIEVRAAANLSGEPELQKIFLEGDGDHHALTASKVFPSYNDPNSPDYKAKSLRSLAKIINFALQYGGTEYTIYESMSKKDPTITRERCKEMVDNYWKGVPVFADWCSRKRARARNEMVCETATGRVINFESALRTKHITKPGEMARKNVGKYYDLRRTAVKMKAEGNDEGAEQRLAAADQMWKNPDTGVRNALEYNKFLGKIERVSVNAPVQGIAGDFMRIALNRIRMWVMKDPLVQHVFRLHGSVHDEIDLSIKNEYVPFILPRLTRLMKLRKYHEQMKWPVPIECDAEYGRSWDVDYNVTDKKHPEAYTKIKGISGYVPDEVPKDAVKKLLEALLSGVEQKRERVKNWLEQSVHPRAFQCAPALMKEKEPKEIKRMLLAILQLHEYWTIDHTPDGDEHDKQMETLEQYERRMGFESKTRGNAPEFGYLGAIPLTANVERPVIEPLGDEPTPDQQAPPSDNTEPHVHQASDPHVPGEPCACDPEPGPMPQVIEQAPKAYILRTDLQREDVVRLRESIGTDGSGTNTITVQEGKGGPTRELKNRKLDYIPQEFLENSSANGAHAR